MKINIGSKNPAKLQAVKEAFHRFNLFPNAEYINLEVSSDVSEQPRGLDEITLGARNRAVNAFKFCDYSVGIEAGMVVAPHTETGYYNTNVCAIYDGERFFIGLGQGFQLPAEITRLVVDEGMELDPAVQRAGYSDSARSGYDQGIIGILSGGLVTRNDFSQSAILMALTQLKGYLQGK